MTPPRHLPRIPFSQLEEKMDPVMAQYGNPSLIPANHSFWNRSELILDETYPLSASEICNYLEGLTQLESLTIKGLPNLSPQVWEGIVKLKCLKLLKISLCKGAFSDVGKLPELPQLYALELQDIGITNAKAQWVCRQVAPDGIIVIMSENLMDRQIATTFSSIKNLTFNMCYLSQQFNSELSRRLFLPKIEHCDVETQPKRPGSINPLLIRV